MTTQRKESAGWRKMSASVRDDPRERGVRIALIGLIVAMAAILAAYHLW
jgi:hypothetical protein